MKLNELKAAKGATQNRKRVGRGIASGTGKTAGRGVKGQKSRSGVSIKGFEGGQMPLHRRLPKRGFHNPNAKTYVVINLGRIQQAVDAGKLNPKVLINAESLKEAGLVKTACDGIRLLAKGDITTKGLNFSISGVSAKAQESIEKLGGTIDLIVKKTNSKAELSAGAE